MSVVVSGLTKVYARGLAPALDHLDLAAPQGDLLVVLGPSGSGKSTLLRCIAGLEETDAGSVTIGERDVTRADPRDRDVAMVFQEHALYPHLDVRTNIAFPLLARKLPAGDIATKVGRAAETLDIAHLLGRRPQELSGGERRRVALARAVVRDPALFLMDEPLANLDTNLKLRVLDEIRMLQETLGTTTLYVTHDQAEAMSLGHRLALLNAGRLEQIGAPLELYDSPANTFVASFLGRTPMNLLPVEVVGGVHGGPGCATVGFRPERCSLATGGDGARVAVRAVDHLGPDALVEVDLAGHRVMVQTARDDAPGPGDERALTIDEARVHRFDAHGRAL